MSRNYLKILELAILEKNFLYNVKNKLHFSWIVKEKFIPLHRFRKTESDMVAVVQLVRASDCGSECRRFESDQPPRKKGT